MATIKFFLQSNTDIAQIYLRLSVARNNTPKRKTGLTIKKSDWSKTTSLPKQTSAVNKNIAADLQQLKAHVFEKLNEANKNGIEINGMWLSDVIEIYFGRKSENKNSDRIIDAIQSLIDESATRKNSKGGIGLSKSRLNSYKSLKRIISEYQGVNNYRVKDVDVKFAKEFLKYLLNDKKYAKSYALKKIADLKTVCYDAETYGIETHPQLKKIDSAKPSKESIIYLTEKELEQIKSVILPSENLKNARKWLLLGCNIGQRGGDLLNINESNFINRNGLDVIELKQKKTGKYVTIPVLEDTSIILKDGLPYKISIQKFNDYIKKICKAASIDKVIHGSKICMVDSDGTIIPINKKGKYIRRGMKRTISGQYPKHELISSHVCRRSFATNLYGKLPTPLIMQITAHGTEKMFLNYIGKNRLDYAQQIADFYTLQAQKKQKESKLNIVRSNAI